MNIKIRLAKKTVLKGGAFSTLISRLLLSDYAQKSKITNKVMELETSVEAIEDYCVIINAEEGPEELMPGVPFSFWALWSRAYAEIEASPHPEADIIGLEVYVYAHDTVLTMNVPDGLPNRLDEEGNVRTISDWFTTWNTSSPTHAVNGSGKVLFATNVNNNSLSKDEVKVLFDWCMANGYELCHKMKYKELLESVEFNSEV